MTVRKIAMMKEVSEERSELKRRYVLPVASRTPNPEHNSFSFNLILFSNSILCILCSQDIPESNSCDTGPRLILTNIESTLLKTRNVAL